MTFIVIGFFRIVTSVDRPLCTCGAHVIWSRHRFAMLNDRPRSQAFKQALKQVINIFVVNLMLQHVGKHTSAIFSCGTTWCCVSSNTHFPTIAQGYFTKFAEKLCPELQPLSLLYSNTILTEKKPLTFTFN